MSNFDKVNQWMASVGWERRSSGGWERANRVFLRPDASATDDEIAKGLITALSAHHHLPMSLIRKLAGVGKPEGPMPARAFRLAEFILDPISGNRVILGAIFRDCEDFKFIRSQITPCVNCIGGEDYFRQYEYFCEALAKDPTGKRISLGPTCRFDLWRPIHDRVNQPEALILGMLPRVKPTFEEALERCSTNWGGALDLMARGPSHGPSSGSNGGGGIS